MISTCVRRQLIRRGGGGREHSQKISTTILSVRNLSSPGMPAAMPNRAPKPIVTPKVGAVVSRRQWNKLYKPPPRQPPPKDTADDKPWPRSIQMLGYAVATTAVPYCIAWFIASNQTARNFLFPRVPGMESVLRKVFGHPEEDYYSYVDYRQQQQEGGDTKLEIPLTLDHEFPFKIRKEQAEVEDLIHEYPVPARIRVFTHGGFNLGEVLHLPGDTPVTSTSLLENLMSDRERTIDPESVAYVTVDFQDVKQENKDAATNNSYTEETDPVLSVHIPSEEQSGGINNIVSPLASHLQELAKSTNIYSKWHYQVSQQPASDQQQKQSASSRKLSDHEMKVAELEYKVEQLQAQLKDNTVMKSFDDLMEEIRQTKSELRRLKWKKRLGMAS